MTVSAFAIPITKVPLGPWQGSKRSTSADLVEFDFISGGSDYLHLPRTGFWKRRKGQTQKFDTFGAAVGHLPAKWGARCRQMEEFKSDAITDGVPTVCSLLTKETMASSSVTDDGRFSNFWVRDQVNSVNYTVGDDFNSTTYPVPGSEASYKFPAFWYDSGEGGMTRGVSEFTRRFFFSGSRRFHKVGRWWYFPSYYGTPTRWSGVFTASAAQLAYGTPSAAALTSGTSWAASAGTLLTCLNDRDTDPTGSDYARWSGVVGNFTGRIDFPVMSDPGVGARFGMRLLMRCSAGMATRMQFTMGYNLGGTTVTSNIVWGGESNVDFTATNYQANVTTAFTGGSGTNGEYAFTMSEADSALMRTGIAAGFQPYISVANQGNVGSETFDIGYISLVVGAVASIQHNRLFPSGPIPPCHAGTLAAGTLVENNTNYERPDADISAGTWTDAGGSGSNLYTNLDETTASDADYIKTPIGGNTACTIGLSNLTITPGPEDVVKVNYRATRGAAVGGTTADLTVELVETATQRAVTQQTLTTSLADYSLTLTSAQISSITNWSNLRLIFTVTGAAAFEIVKVSFANVSHAANPATLGGWRGSDKFFYSVAYRFEDDSIWMPCTPRAPNTILANGFNLFTINSSNLTAAYDSVVWSNIPVGPFGTKSRLLLRSPKIDSSTDSTLTLDPTDLRLVWEIEDNTTTTYTDYYADDSSLTTDHDQLLIRDDHVMTPRSRYAFGGDSRMCVSYGSLNPVAIILAPVSLASDTTYDLNADDETASLWSATNSSYFKLSLTDLVLVEDTGAATSTTTFTFSATIATLENLVDSINATSVAVDGRLWRAQVAPGANPQAPLFTAGAAASCLTPTIRAITSCVVSGQTITKAAGGLNDVAVGNFITGAGATVTSSGPYVSSIDSDTQLTFVGTITAGTKTLTFVSGVGDTITGASNGASEGYTRVIANSLPQPLYFNKSYLDQFVTQKSTVWMTVSSPGSVKSAPNCFSGKIDNRHTPPLEAGISMGGCGIDNGFFVPMSNKRCVIRNTRDAGTGFDYDYRIFVTNESSGCAAWNSVVGGNRIGFCVAPEGVIASDLFNEVNISEAIWQHPTSDAVVGTGDFSYEMPKAVSATGADVDYLVSDSSIVSYITAKVMRSALWITYRSTSGHPNRMIVYDFSSGPVQNGLEALVRPAGYVEGLPQGAWGWSLPLVRSMTAMCEGRRSDGTHLYGWNEANAGSTGDGRIDEFETSDTDNGTTISASATTPWLKVGQGKISVQEVTSNHSSPAGSTVFFDFHRSYEDTTYSFTPTVGSTLVVSRDIFQLLLEARSPTSACYFGWRQTVGGAQEIRGHEVRLKVLPSFV